MRHVARAGWLSGLVRNSIGIGVVTASLATPIDRLMAQDKPRADVSSSTIPQDLKPQLTLPGRLVSKDGTLMLRVRVQCQTSKPDAPLTKDVFLATPANEGSAPLSSEAAIADDPKDIVATISTDKADYDLKIVRFSTRLPIVVQVECKPGKDNDKPQVATYSLDW